MPKVPLIALDGISKKYQIDGSDFFAIKDINLAVYPGEYTSIVGPSGSGKSTLMHIVGLLDRPSSGKILVNQKDTSALSDNQLSSLRNEFVGFVFQQFNLVNKLTVLENILLPSIYAKREPVSNLHQKAMELVNRFGITEKINTFPNRLSGGQQQRVAISRALIMNPQLILADEPTGNLDTATGEIIIKILEELNKKDGVTVVLITHDETLSHRTHRQIKIRDGEIWNI